MNRIAICVFGLFLLWSAADIRCQDGEVAENPSLPSMLTSKHLANPVQVHAKVISGGLPEDDAAFKELAERGIKTIISVDGMKPDVELARKHGLRYVHLPHGYDGIPDARVKELAKAVRDLEGPIYIHCHHGKHRSPAAASVACVSAGLIQPDAAIPILELAGTNPNYRGLYKAARSAQPISGDLLDALTYDFKEVQDIPAMAEAMVETAHAHEHLGLIEAAQWKTPSDHPDLVPAHEALLLQESFTELLRHDETAEQPTEFLAMLRESEAAAHQLYERLSVLKDRSTSPSQQSEFSGLYKRISDNCKSCHVQYRDVPLDEKR